MIDCCKSYKSYTRFFVADFSVEKLFELSYEFFY